jgi:hypothetical protein
LRGCQFEPRSWDFLSLEFDVYSWFQTLLNRVGMPNALLYRWLHTHSNLTTRERQLAGLSLLLALPLGTLSAVLTAVGAVLRNGSTMEVYAIRQ